jgi:hypothetical protein
MRKVTAIVSAQSRERERLAGELEDELVTHVRRCIDNLMALANGVMVKVETKDGTIDAFERPPDRLANEYILNRLLGRPPSKKPLAAAEAEDEPLIDISKIPKDRLETMERWLAEIDNGEV